MERMMSWDDFTGITYDRRSLIARLDQIKWDGTFRPAGIVLHNTAAPTLAQWAEDGPNHEARIRNLKAYYQGLGWHAGPHWFVSREHFTEFMDPRSRGTHSPSFNANHFGIEMVGDYDSESFDSGDGAKVRDNAVFLMAYLCNRFGWDPAKVIKLHKEDPNTTHACPGSKVSKKDVIDRVRAQMANLGAEDRPSVDEGDVTVFKDIIATTFGGGSDNQASAYGGMIDGDIRLGASLPARFAGKPPNIVVRSNVTGKEVSVPIRDVGPWLIDDPYWETGERPVAESNVIIPRGKNKGKNSNGAGIDLTPATLYALGLNPVRGKWRVDWWFDCGGAARPPKDNDDPPLTDKGDRSSYVAYAQKLLGFDDNECDGIFGPVTERAVKWFQRRNGLQVDGQVGEETWAALQETYEGEV